MNARVVLAFAVTMAGLLVLAWPREAGGPLSWRIAETAGTGTAEPLRADQGAVTPERDGEERETERSQTWQRTSVPVPTGSVVMLLGRCVAAETGLPLAGCEIGLGLDEPGGSSLERYLLRHGEPPALDLEPRVTGEDGRFSFTLEPPESFALRLDIRTDGRVSMTGRFGPFQPGTTRDFGDIPIEIGSRVSGRVVDTEGAAQGDVEVSFDGGFMVTGIYPVQEASARTRPDGAFELAGRLAPRSWTVEVADRRLVGANPTRLNLEPGGAPAALDLVVRAAAEIQTITGSVVDQSGHPVADANVRFSSQFFSGRSVARSGSDGSFTIQRSAGEAADSSAITVDKAGYELFASPAEYEWDTSGLVLALSRGLSLEVQVLDADSGEPIENYGVLCYASERGRSSIEERRLQLLGHHERGLSVIEGVRTGTNALSVKPSGTDYAPSLVRSIDVTADGAPTQVFRLRRNAVVTLEVVTADGSPVRGTIVQLLRTPDESPISANTGAYFNRTSAPSGTTTLDEGETDDNGSIRLRGPPGEKLALHLPGPAHPPMAVNGFVLDPAIGTARVVVPTGARIVGRVVPPEAFRSFVPEPHAGFTHRPSIGLVRVVEGARPSRTREFSIRVDEDGSLDLRGIPPGTWDLHLSYSDFPGTRSEGAVLRTLFIQTLHDLAEGETRQVEVDIGRFRRGVLSAKLFLNGRPLARADVTPEGSFTDGRGDEQSARLSTRATSEAGDVTLEFVPGTYTLKVWDARTRRTMLIREEIAVGPGAVIERVFQLWTRGVRVLALAPDGKTRLAGIRLYLQTEDGAWILPASTDADGVASFENVPVEALQVGAYPKGLDGSVQRGEHRSRTGEDVGLLDLLLIDAGGAGPDVAVTVVMPEASGY